MSTEVYSAAKAVIVEKGVTKKELWDNLTSMFNVKSDKIVSLIEGSHLLEPLNNSSANPPQINDVFKYTGLYGSEMYLKILNWRPHELFAYKTLYSSLDAQKISKQTDSTAANKMEFYLQEHFEGTILEVIRRQKGVIPSRFNIFAHAERETLINGAKTTLTNIIEKFYNELGRSPHSTYIQRDDSLRNDF